MNFLGLLLSIFLPFNQLWNTDNFYGDNVNNHHLHKTTNNKKLAIEVASNLDNNNSTEHISSTADNAIFPDKTVAVVGPSKTALPSKNNDNDNNGKQCGYSPYSFENEQFFDVKSKGGIEAKALKIINGQPVKDIRQFPWLVSMEFPLLPFFSRSFECSGTIISKWHILTAGLQIYEFDTGHCVGFYLFLRGHGYKNWKKHQTDDFIITAGVANRSDDKSEGVQKISSKWLIPHPNAAFKIDWTPGPDAPSPFMSVVINDIAIIELSKPLNFTEKVRPICLNADDQQAFNKNGIVAGWGLTDRNDMDYLDPQLHFGHMLIDQDACKNYTLFEPKEQFCITSAKGTTEALCHGDSGGAMMFKFETEKKNKKDSANFYWSQVGIISMGNGKYPCFAPDLVIRVSHYCDWIANVTEKLATCI